MTHEQIIAEMRNFADVADRCAITEGNAPAAIRVWASQLAALQQRCEAAEAERDALRRDAERWRAVIGCARVRLLGSAGLTGDVNPHGQPWNGYAHIGLELWTRHEPVGNEPSDAAQWLTKYADIAAALHGQQDGSND